MKRQWLLYSIGGLVLCGFGLSLLGEAILYKMTNNFNWFYWGTAALVVFNSGICLIGEAILIKVRMQKQN